MNDGTDYRAILIADTPIIDVRAPVEFEQGGNKKAEKGLSLIESAMVLALAATVTAGVMFYYQSASDSNKTQSAISEVMSATSAITKLYGLHDLYDEFINGYQVND